MVWPYIQRNITKKKLNMAAESKRNRGRPGLRWMDVINQSMKKFNLKTDEAMDRNLRKNISPARTPKLIMMNMFIEKNTIYSNILARIIIKN